MTRAAILVCLLPILISGCKTAQNGGDLSNTNRYDDKGPQVIACPFPDPFASLTTVYFDYDCAQLRADALKSLQENAAELRTSPDARVMIAGHCDERGTQEYNMALGQKRAERVREYLVSLGIPRDRLVTISYGEEQPADPGHSEAAWSLNRRCQFEAN